MKTINLNEVLKIEIPNYSDVDSVWMLDKVQHEVVSVETEEGPSNDFSWIITLTNFYTQEEYELKTLVIGKLEHHEEGSFYITGRDRAMRIIKKIKSDGIINLENWVKR